MPDFKKLAQDAAAETDAQFVSRLSDLTRLRSTELQKLLDEGLKREDIAAVLDVVKAAGLSNQQKAKNIAGIGKGLEVLVGLASKLL
ncbi:MAG: hypothetical protein IPK70_05075 [Flavobacteriales bacterium]|jgi:hypothetical protein|nr:hypothetical protein [Flavobacteriales bacterium]